MVGKRIIACGMSLALALSLAPSLAFAAEGEIVKADEAVTLSAGNDSRSDADPISTGVTVASNLTSSSDVDYFRFELPAAGRVTLSFGTDFVDASSGWTVKILDANGNELESQSWRQSEFGTGDLSSTEIGLSAGTYYVSVEKRSSLSSSLTTATYRFCVNYEQRSDWETEFNDSRSEADVVATGTTYYGAIAFSSDEDFYRFELPAAGRVTLSFGTDFVDASSGWAVKILDASGNVLESRSWQQSEFGTGDLSSAEIGLPAGTYYVSVEKRSSLSSSLTTATYRFCVNYEQRSDWETEWNNSRSEADTIATGNTYYGSIMSSSDEDYYCFTQPTDGRVIITFGTDFVDSSGGWTVRLLDADGNALERWVWQQSDFAGGYQNSDAISLSAGTYYVSVEKRSSLSSSLTTATYHFRVNALGDYFTDVDYAGSTADGGWMAEWVDIAASLGLMSGYRNASGALTGAFGPQDLLTRGQAIVVLYRAITGASDSEPYGVNETPSTESDVVGSNYYTNALNWAYENGIMTGDIVNGVSQYTFRPNDYITRQEVAILVWRAAGEPAASSTSAYASAADAGSEWASATEALQWTASEGILSGSQDSSGIHLNPFNNTRRGEAAKIFVMSVDLF